MEDPGAQNGLRGIEGMLDPDANLPHRDLSGGEAAPWFQAGGRVPVALELQAQLRPDRFAEPLGRFVANLEFRG